MSVLLNGSNDSETLENFWKAGDDIGGTWSMLEDFAEQRNCIDNVQLLVHKCKKIRTNVMYYS